MIYEIDLHFFAQKLSSLMKERGMVDKKGNPDSKELYKAMYPNNIETDSKNGQSLTDKARAQDNWIKGKNFPQDITKLLELCNALNCNLDYFFTPMQEATHDMHYICEETGLTTQSVETLKKLHDREQYYTDHDMKILNYILSNTGEFSNFINNIGNYIDNQYQIPLHEVLDENGNIHSEALLDPHTGEPYVGILFGQKAFELNGKQFYNQKGVDFSILESHCMLEIQKQLTMWQANYKSKENHETTK